MLGEVEEPRVPANCASAHIVLFDRLLHVIDQDLLGNTESAKSTLKASQQHFSPSRGGKVGIQHTAVAQHEDKAVEPPSLSALDDGAALAPIDLCLLASNRLETFSKSETDLPFVRTYV